VLAVQSKGVEPDWRDNYCHPVSERTTKHLIVSGGCKCQ
jgi:hypothetical protein